ncbi:related to U3 snoRNP [Lecanosticta acicola]|uniref:U3 small nucleolar ribonucleoprotein protein MPP10 n=1 Tax=Lecanosticta acicola TaxID=111012 RepID=A0AAI9EED2_9PEZI|nr:related to U3 snoRNP [Lecanosticta acicola]
MAAATESNVLLSTLTNTPHDLLQPSLPLYTDAIAYLKSILDPLATEISTEQQDRLKEARKKRKRGEEIEEHDVLRLKKVHAEGFGVGQVWEQAKRVIEAARSEAEREYDAVKANLGDRTDDEDEDEDEEQDEVDGEDDDLGVEGVDYEVEGEDDGEEEYEGEDGEMGENEDDLDMDGPHDYDEMAGDEDERTEDEPAQEFVADRFGLNDGFFSIDDFNKQSEFLEQQDARGEDDGAASDEEDIDFDADPLAQAASGAQANGDGAEESPEEDNEDGPTFGDPDAPSEDEDEELEGGDLDDMGGMGNTNDVMYADFFAPPAQKKRKNKKGRPNPHNFPEPSTNGKTREEEDDDMERTMAAVHRDLFDESEEEGDEEEEGEQLDPSDPRSRRSTHERRKAALTEEIRKLEAANVAKREWQLTGEARAADRPINSLLQEDLEFERAGKPVPVITAEVSESIEELIKRRILAHEFEDIIRRRPDDLATGKEGKRGRLDFELDDTKSKKGLAEEYEEEHLRRTDPNFVDVKDEKLQKEQKEIEKLWKEVCGQLDSLSSWHFRPKQPAPQLDIRVDAPAVTMEDARPSAGGEVAGASQLAPQEVYKGGEASDKRQEVVGKSGLPAGHEELSREERKRRRRREKERIRKSSGNDTSQTESRAAKAKKGKDGVIADLKRGGVKVIGKKGAVTDVEGRNVGNDGSAGQGAAKYKL